ncbi:hypothetical protein GCM10023205_63690 [Yinghuangia aomiensis]|uniref:DUF4333 domain-containing protein n=1 Tax=Yinghuangia aomiensis TaxID=676205 RepID=A0ABP9I1Z0_9ACTN
MTVRVADQKNTARFVMATSSLVIAACSVAVAVKVTGSDFGSPPPPRLMDPGALQQRVADQVQGYRDTPVTRVSCPASIVVKVGTRFTCHFWDGRMGEVPVTISSDQGDITLGNPTRF